MSPYFRSMAFSNIRILFSAIAMVFALALSSACASDYSEEQMQRLAATAADIAHAVRNYARHNPKEAGEIDDIELVKRATAHAPSLLLSYREFVVRGRPQGVVLICDAAGTRGLIEDAACTVFVDRIEWRNPQTPCRFTLDTAVVCRTAQ